MAMATLDERKMAKAKEKELVDEEPPRKLRFITVEPVQVLYFLALTSGSSLMTQYVYAEIARDMNYTRAGSGDNGYCVEQDENSTDDSLNDLQQEVQATTARFMIWLDLAETVPELLIVMLLGPLSDVLGRRPTLVLPVAGLALKYILVIAVQYWDLPLELVILANFFDGVSGSASILFGTCYSYLSDIYKGHDRSIRITTMITGMMIASTISNLFMGHFINETGFTYPLFLVLGYLVVNLFYILFALKESRPRDRNAKIVTIDHLRKGLRVIFRPTIKENGWKLCVILACFVTVGVLNSSQRGVISLFLMNSPLCWGPVLLGYYRSFSGVISK